MKFKFHRIIFAKPVKLKTKIQAARPGKILFFETVYNYGK